MFKVLKSAWTGVVNLGWVAVLVIGLSKADLYKPTTPAHGAEPHQPTVASPKEVAKPDPPKVEPPAKPAELGLPRLPTNDEMMASIRAESDRKEAERAEMDRLKEQVSKEAQEREAANPRPPVWRAKLVPCPAPNLHETHEDGEPYEYSFARQQNNELRWVINEFRWRLKDPLHDHKKFWNLADIDGEQLNAPLPNNVEGVQKQNWDLAWRASQLVAIFNNEKPTDAEKAPPMPKGTVKVPIPTPNCNTDFCRVR